MVLKVLIFFFIKEFIMIFKILCVVETELIAINFRHIDITYYKIIILTNSLIISFKSVACCVNLVYTFFFHHLLQNLLNKQFIIYYQNFYIFFFFNYFRGIFLLNILLHHLSYFNQISQKLAFNNNVIKNFYPLLSHNTNSLEQLKFEIF
jgi:hypothetical protein